MALFEKSIHSSTTEIKLDSLLYSQFISKLFWYSKSDMRGWQRKRVEKQGYPISKSEFDALAPTDIEDAPYRDDLEQLAALQDTAFANKKTDR